MYYTQVGDSFDRHAFINEGMYAVTKSKSARFVQMHHDGSVHLRGWGAALIIAELKMYFSTKEKEYVLVNTMTDNKVVVFRGQPYDCALFIARRARAFGFNLYATDVPLEDSHEEA